MRSAIPCPNCKDDQYFSRDTCLLCDGSGIIASPITGADYLHTINDYMYIGDEIDKWIEEALGHDPEWVRMIHNLAPRERAMFLKLRTGNPQVDDVLDKIGEGYSDNYEIEMVLGAYYEVYLETGGRAGRLTSIDGNQYGFTIGYDVIFLTKDKVRRRVDQA